MNADAPVVSIKKITDDVRPGTTAGLHFYEKECYATQGATGYYLWFRLKTAPGQEYIPSAPTKRPRTTRPASCPAHGKSSAAEISGP